MNPVGKKIAVIVGIILGIGLGAKTVLSEGPTPSEEYVAALNQCVFSVEEDCCTLANGNQRRAVACIITECGPSAIDPDPAGSIAAVAHAVKATFPPPDGGPCL